MKEIIAHIIDLLPTQILQINQHLAQLRILQNPLNTRHIRQLFVLLLIVHQLQRKRILHLRRPLQLPNHFLVLFAQNIGVEQISAGGFAARSRTRQQKRRIRRRFLVFKKFRVRRPFVLLENLRFQRWLVGHCAV